MLDTGSDAARGSQGFPHGIGGADDVIFMPLQCSTQWDGLGHIFDHGLAWNGRDAAVTVTSDGDLATGIEHLARPVCGRGVRLAVGRVAGDARGELADGFAITEEHLAAAAAAHGVTVGRGDLVLVRTGRYARALRDGWGDYAGGASPGLSFTTAGWLHRTEIAAIATDTCNNTFSYFLDPHGNTVEYATELELVDEDTWHPHQYDFTQPEVADQWGTANAINEFVARRSFNDVDPGLFIAPPV